MLQLSATHISGAAEDVKRLCSLWGKDGLKLVYSCISSNPSFDKIEKQDCTDIATRIYEQLEDSGGLNTAQAENYLNIWDNTEEKSSSSSANAVKTPLKTVVSGLKDITNSTSKWNTVKKLMKSNKLK